MKKLFATTLLSTAVAFSAQAQDVTGTIHANQGTQKINKEIYGQFAEHLGSCIYGGLWVGPDSKIPNTQGYRNDVLQALKDLKVPVLRWPGGCFADEYHWMDGIGPREKRPKMQNNNWGGTIEDNSFGTHEFLNLCEMLGCEPYISGNVGSGTVEELAKWVEYMTSDGDTPMAKLRRQNGRDKAWKVKYLGVGNESWGCGGNMRPEYYSDLFRRYSVYCRNYDGNQLYKIASGASDYDYNWTKVLMDRIGNRANAISLHYYTVTGWSGSKGSATKFNNEDYYWTMGKALGIEDVIKKHEAIMDKADPKKQVARHYQGPPLSAELYARCLRCSTLAECIPPPYRACEDDQYRTDCQRTPINDPDRYKGNRSHGSDSNLSCIQHVQGLPGGNLSPNGCKVRLYGCSRR